MQKMCGKTRYLIQMAAKKHVKIIIFRVLFHCKTIDFHQCFERVLKYEVLFSWFNSDLPFTSKKHNKKRVKNT